MHMPSSGKGRLPMVSPKKILKPMAPAAAIGKMSFVLV